MRESQQEIITFVSPVASTPSTLTLFVFSSITRLFEWNLPAASIHAPKNTVPQRGCRAGGAERRGLRRCWDAWREFVGWSVSSPCRRPSSSSSCSAPSVSSSQPTSSMASSGSWSHQLEGCPGPRVPQRTLMTQGSPLPDCYLYGVSLAAPEWILQGPGQILWFWCLWKASILNWVRRSWLFWRPVGSGTGLRYLPEKETCLHWRTKRGDVSHWWFMKTFLNMLTWTLGIGSYWTSIVWNTEWASLVSSRSEQHHTFSPPSSSHLLPCPSGSTISKEMGFTWSERPVWLNITQTLSSHFLSLSQCFVFLFCSLASLSNLLFSLLVFSADVFIFLPPFTLYLSLFSLIPNWACLP